MKYLLLFLLALNISIAQDSRLEFKGQILGPPEGKPAEGFGRLSSDDIDVYYPQLEPFYHGVASGDPLTDRVIIWTRVTTDQTTANVSWQMATDVGMQNVVADGSQTTGSDVDYTIKVDVGGLEPGTTYYYQFEYDGKKSLIGRTRTAPAQGSLERLRFAIVSCVNYQWGYFAALERISERADLDAVIHLGDYLYEYGPEDYNHPDIIEIQSHEPEYETVTLADYRLRFSQYRLEPDMIKFHQQHPVIAVWDDHESTNDSWKDGADNHQPGEEGDWSDRVDASTEVYAEWMPIRVPNEDEKREIYREFSYGDMLDLYMMELRLSGRDEPMGTKSFGPSFDNLDEEELEALFDEDRQMIGDDQYQWLTEGIRNSDAKWKLMGSSVMMTSFPTLFNADAWDGYYQQRERLFNFLLDNDVENVGAISGDIHMSFAADLITKSYTDIDNAELVGFEFTTPSVSSANINELTILPYPDPETGETKIIFPLQDRLPERSEEVVALESFLVESNDWINYINSDQHGYILLDVTEEKIQSDWYHVGDVRDFENDEESATMSMAVNSGDPKMQMVDTPTSDKQNAPELAPFPSTSSVESDVVLNMGVYPNPVVNTAMINFATNKTQNVLISIYNLSGEKILEIANTTFTKGVHGIPFNAEGLINGVYIVRIETESGTKAMKFVK